MGNILPRTHFLSSSGSCQNSQRSVSTHPPVSLCSTRINIVPKTLVSVSNILVEDPLQSGAGSHEEVQLQRSVLCPGSSGAPSWRSPSPRRRGRGPGRGPGAGGRCPAWGPRASACRGRRPGRTTATRCCWRGRSRL